MCTKEKALTLEEGHKWDRDHAPGMDLGMVSPQVVLRALWGAGWGRHRTGPSAVPSPAHSSLPTAVIDLGFLAQIGFLFGLNSIPHPACEEAQGLRRTLGQRAAGRRRGVVSG